MPMTNPMRYGATPPGSTTQIAYNNAGAWGGASSMTWNETLDVLGLDQVAVTLTGFAAVATAPTATLAGLGAGAIPVGVYNYKLQWYSLNADSAESTVSNNVTVAAGDGQVVITIPVHPSSKCSGVRVYRSTVTGVVPWKLVATITNNTGASVTDNAAAGTTILQDYGHPYGKILCGTVEAISFDSSGRVLIGGASAIGAYALNARGRYTARLSNDDYTGAGVGNYTSISFGAASGVTTSTIQAFSRGGTAYASLVFQPSGGNVGINTGTLVPTKSLGLGGTAARTAGMERHTTADTAGNNLTVQAGGCTANATNKGGGVLTLGPGTTTGAGLASVCIHRALRSAAATTDNAYADAIVVPSEFPLTHEASNSLFEVALPTLTNFCGHVIFGITAGDGTDVQAYSGTVDIAAQNKGGVYTHSIVESTATTKTSDASLLTVAWDISEGADKITITVTPTSSLVPTSMKAYYTLISNSAQTVTQL
jgi:hypothetical protein